MRAYIAAVLLTAGFGRPGVAETAQPLAKVQQPGAEQAAQLNGKRRHRRAVATRGRTREPDPRTAAATARAGAGSGPTRIVPEATVGGPGSPSPSSWSNSMLSWWRGESTPPGPGRSTAGNFGGAGGSAGRNASGDQPNRPRQTAARGAGPPRANRRQRGGAGRRRPRSSRKADAKQAAQRQAQPIPRDRQVAIRSTAGRPEKAAGGSAAGARQKAGNSQARPQAARRPSLSVGSRCRGRLDQPGRAEGGAQQMAAVSNEHDATGGEATWWQRQGNPVVFNFRDCVASYASREAARSKEGTWADLLIRATESDCRAAVRRDGPDARQAVRRGQDRAGDAGADRYDLPAGRQTGCSGRDPVVRHSAASGHSGRHADPVKAVSCQWQILRESLPAGAKKPQIRRTSPARFSPADWRPSRQDPRMTSMLKLLSALPIGLSLSIVAAAPVLATQGATDQGISQASLSGSYLAGRFAGKQRDMDLAAALFPAGAAR